MYMGIQVHACAENKRGAPSGSEPLTSRGLAGREREFFIDNLLVRIHFIIVMIRWTGLVPWEFEFPFPGSLTSTFFGCKQPSGPSASFHSVCTGKESTFMDCSVPEGGVHNGCRAYQTKCMRKKEAKPCRVLAIRVWCSTQKTRGNTFAPELDTLFQFGARQ